MLTTTSKQILDCTISYIKVQHPYVNLQKEIIQNMLYLKKIYTKQNMKNSYNQKTIFSRKNIIILTCDQEPTSSVTSENTVNVRTHTTVKICHKTADLQLLQKCKHKSLEIKAVKRLLLSCSYISCNIKVLIKHMFHLLLVDPGETFNPTVTILPTEWVNALPGKRAGCASQQIKPAHNAHTS